MTAASSPATGTARSLARLYASADLFVFPSLTETFGNVVLEAMASGLPAIGFAVQGPGDIIRDGRTGRLVRTVHADSCARHDARTGRQRPSAGRWRDTPAVTPKPRAGNGSWAVCAASYLAVPLPLSRPPHILSKYQPA